MSTERDRTYKVRSDKKNRKESHKEEERCDERCDETCDERQVGKKELFFDDFCCGFKPEQLGSPYEFFSVPAAQLVANDAVGGVSASCQGLVINSVPFTYTNPTGLDHVKFLVYQRDAYNAPRNGAEIVYEGLVAAEQTGLGGLPAVLQAQGGSLIGVNNVNSDIRIAAAGFNCLDEETLLVFDFIFSNEDIYAFYERLPFLRTEFGGPGPNYTAFSHAIPVAKRNVASPINDFVKLAIAYNYKDNYVRWLVNDEEVFRVNRLGYPIERKYRILEHNQPGQFASPVEIIRPKQLKFGFGTFSLFDMYNPQNPGQINNAALVDLTVGGSLPDVNPLITNVNGTTIAPTFLSPYPIVGFNGTNFGQGLILRVKYLTVYLLAPPEEKRNFPCLKHCREVCRLSRCHLNSIHGVNSDSDIIAVKCKGYIDDTDDCDLPSQQCDCPFAGTNNCHHRYEPTIKFRKYKPHTKKLSCRR